MTDPTDPRGFTEAMQGFPTGSQSLQSFVSEMQRMGKESYDKSTQLMDKLRSAKTMEDVMSVQTSFMQQSFAASAEYTRRFSELMIALPMEMARNGRDTFQKGNEAMRRAGEEAGHEMQKAGEQFTQHQG